MSPIAEALRWKLDRDRTLAAQHRVKADAHLGAAEDLDRQIDRYIELLHRIESPITDCNCRPCQETR